MQLKFQMKDLKIFFNFDASLSKSCMKIISQPELVTLLSILSFHPVLSTPKSVIIMIPTFSFDSAILFLILRTSFSRVNLADLKIPEK